MAKKIVVEGDANCFKYCEELEAGNLLFFPKIPFDFPSEEIDFLLKQRQGGSRARKNIAYKPDIDAITNHSGSDAEQLKEILRSYSRRVTEFLTGILAPYAEGWKHDYASFRPFQEKGRNLRTRARNDLLHVDAFPTRPIHGARILRFFTNINPTEDRHWITSKPFEELAAEFQGKIDLPSSCNYSLKNRLGRKMKELMGLKMRSPYDQFMLKMHHFLKENEQFQRECPKDHWKFPPHSCWAVFTDQVSHAALAGQYALEQTFLIPPHVLLCPEKAPVCVLERLTGKNMINPDYSAQMFPAVR